MTTMPADLEHEAPTGSALPAARLLCAATAAAAVAVVPLMGGVSGDSGAEATQYLTDNAGRLQGASILAVFVAAGLLLAAVRVGQHLRESGSGSTTAAVATAAGVAVSVLYAGYYTSIGSGAVVSSMLLEDPGAGVGESTLVLLNLVELTRYAPGLVLLVAAVVVRRVLPRPVWIVAAFLAALTVVPMTSWAAAVAVPVWLAATAAALRKRQALR
jgi:hypothetical protein